MARGSLHFDFPRRAAAAGDGAGFPDGALEGEGEVAALGGVEEGLASDFHGAAHGLFVTRHYNDDLGVGQGTDGVQRAQRVDDHEVAALDVAGAGAEGLVAGTPKISAGQDRVEMADEEQALALGATVFGDEVTGATIRRGRFNKFCDEAERGELGVEDVGHFADAGEILGGAVDLDGLLKVAGEVAGLRADGGDDFFLHG